MRKDKKVGCPRSGCNFYTSAAAAEDAMTEMKEHFQEVHGTDEVPEEVRKSLEGDIKNRSRTRA
jgi:predicted small metal-binding protein